jgi:flagellar biosynthesis protein FlhB
MGELLAERTHPASPNRQQQLRAQGSVPKSRAVVTASILLGATVGLLWFGEEIVEGLIEGMRGGLQTPPVTGILSTDDATRMLWEAGLRGVIVGAPMLLAVAMLAISGNLLQSRWFWLPQKVAPDWARLSPVERWQQLCHADRLVDGLWSGAGVVLVTFVGVTSLWARRAQILELSQLVPEVWPMALMRLILETIFHLALATIAIAVLDYALESRRWSISTQQSETEIRDEQRDREGDPLIRNQRRARASARADTRSH